MFKYVIIHKESKLPVVGGNDIKYLQDMIKGNEKEYKVVTKNESNSEIIKSSKTTLQELESTCTSNLHWFGG